MRKLLQFSSNVHSLFSVFVVESFMFVTGTSVTIRTMVTFS